MVGDEGGYQGLSWSERRRSFVPPVPSDRTRWLGTHRRQVRVLGAASVVALVAAIAIAANRSAEDVPLLFGLLANVLLLTLVQVVIHHGWTIPRAVDQYDAYVRASKRLGDDA